MRRVPILALVAPCLLASLGCKDFGFPKLFHPGPVEYQQQRAQKFDPYPEYGPGIDQTRPLQYDRPPPEASRGRWEQWGAPRFGYN